MWVVMVHGSVETPDTSEYQEGLARAVAAGAALLSEARGRGKAADPLEVACAAVERLERDALFNAGVGSVLNLAGQAEMDAAVVDGETGRFGAVGAITGVATPVQVAKRLLAETAHVFLAGEGATGFARSLGFPEEDCRTAAQIAAWEEATELIAREGPDALRKFSSFTGLHSAHDTVGCVVRDEQGRLVAASSTGGSFLKLPGRIGDTPCLGGGIYASRRAAVVCTGRGEACIELLLAREAERFVAMGSTAKEAAREAVALAARERGACVGILVLDAEGRYAAAHNGCSFPVGLIVDGRQEEIQPEYVEP